MFLQFERSFKICISSTRSATMGMRISSWVQPILLITVTRVVSSSNRVVELLKLPGKARAWTFEAVYNLDVLHRGVARGVFPVDKTCRPGINCVQRDDTVVIEVNEQGSVHEDR